MKESISHSLVSSTKTTPSSKTTLHRRVLSLAIIQALACGSSALNAATITVDSTADNVTVDGSCTLREAIEAANTDTGADCTAGSGADTINFDNSLSGSTVTLGGTELSITDSLSIDGDLNDDGAPDIEINANDSSRVININPASNSVDVTLEGLTISGGNSTSEGAGVRSQFNYGSDFGANLTISNSVISGNTALFSNGAGVYLAYTNSLTVNNSSISGNTADGRSGGGIYGNKGNISLTNSTVSGNTADDGSGGGIYSYKGNISLTNSTVSGNSARRNGGGILAYYGTITLTDSTVSGNSSETYGGGVFARYEDVTLTNSTVSGNTSIRDGGGIRAYYGNITLTNSTVSGNSSDSSGGGTFAPYGDVTLMNSTVSGNTSTEKGGGIWAYSGSITLTNSTVSGNTSTTDNGGGIWMYGGSLTLTNSTVSDNSADDSGGGIFADGAGQGFSTTFSMVNSILANSDTGGDCGGGFDTITGSNSLVEDGGAACGITGVNITSLLTVDPQLDPLADNDGPTLTHLPQVGSPVIDAGDNTDCGTGLTITTDQRGGARNDGLCDIGAVEGSDPLPTVASVQFDSTTATVSEDGSSIILNLTRSGDTLSEISVDYSTSDGTATAPGDYTANINTLNFATGITSQTVTIDITDDSDVESDEDFTLTLSNVQLVSGTVTAELGANAVTTVTITDDDTATPGGDNGDSSSSSSTLGLSPWWSMLILTAWLRRRFKS